MIIGVPKEIKEQEYRVALLPSAACQLIKRGHRVLVERQAGTVNVTRPSPNYRSEYSAVIPFSSQRKMATVRSLRPFGAPAYPGLK